MLKYPCLILDHDDTVVQSETSVNYPCFLEFLKVYRPGATLTLEEYMGWCSELTFVEMCRTRFHLTDEEMALEYRFWKDYIRSHIPAPFPGIREILHRHRSAGGMICVVSMSSEEIIRRDYRAHFGLEPDVIFDCELPEDQRKPNPYALNRIMADYGFRKDQLLVLDDMKFGWQMARDAGVPIGFAAWSRQAFPKLLAQMRELCDYSFDTTEKLYNFLFD